MHLGETRAYEPGAVDDAMSHCETRSIASRVSSGLTMA